MKQGHNKQAVLQELVDGLKRGGRAIDTVFTGANVPKIDRAEHNKDLAKWLLGTGLGAGALAGTGVAAAKYLRDMERDDESTDPDRLDDDTVYIQPSKSASALAVPGLALTGSVVGSVGLYALVQKIANKIRKKQLQGDLDAEQAKLQSSIDREREVYKQANSGQGHSGGGVGDALLAGVLGIPLLTMLASGALTKRTLDHAYPSIARKPAPLRRVEFSKKPDSIEEKEEQAAAEEENVVKEAAYQEFDDAGYEFLATVVSNMGGKNSTNDLINAAGHGLIPHMEGVAKSAGAEAVLGTLEGIPKASDRNRSLGVMGLLKSAMLSPTVKLMAAAEFAEKMPTILGHMDFDNTEQMVKMSHFASIMGAESRRNAFPDTDLTGEFDEASLVKKASLTSLRDLIQGSIMGGLEGPGASENEKEEIDANLNSDVNGMSMGSGQEMAQGLIDDESDKSKDDPIDQMLSGAHNESTLGAANLANEG